VPFAPGGATDVIGRLMAQRLTDSMKVQVVVDNRPGAGSVLGTDLAAKAPADGYTLVMTNGSAITTGPHLRPSTPYRPMEDFIHVALIGTFPNAFVVRTENPLKSFAEFVAQARARPGTVKYSSAGVGSAGFLTGEMLNQRAATAMTHIAYKGTGPADGGPAGRADRRALRRPAHCHHAGACGQGARAGRHRRAPRGRLPRCAHHERRGAGVIGEALLRHRCRRARPHRWWSASRRRSWRIVNAPEVQARLVELGMAPLALGRRISCPSCAPTPTCWGPVIKAANIKVE
jgi:hypothetical protein